MKPDSIYPILLESENLMPSHAISYCIIGENKAKTTNAESLFICAKKFATKEEALREAKKMCEKETTAVYVLKISHFCTVYNEDKIDKEIKNLKTQNLLLLDKMQQMLEEQEKKALLSDKLLRLDQRLNEVQENYKALSEKVKNTEYSNEELIDAEIEMRRKKIAILDEEIERLKYGNK